MKRCFLPLPTFFAMLISLFFLFSSDAYSAQATLAWDANTEPELAGYKIYYGTASRNYTHSIDVGNNTSCSVSGLEEGKTYYFAATAYDFNSNESSFSNETSQDIAKIDTDGDGISDNDEINIYGTDPNNPDTDNDGILDGEEINIYGTDPNNPDTDNDGILDDEEIGSGTIEAEWGTLTSPMQIVSDIAASGGSYVESTQSESGTAIYTFSIDNPGVYKIIARVYAPNAGSDSFYVNIDDQGEFIWDLNPAQDPNTYNIWRNDEITNRGTGTFDNPQYDPYTVELSQGEHTLVIRGRESSARLDYFYFEKVGDITPVDIEAPSVSIAAPEYGATISGTSNIEVVASDDTAVTKVELYVNGVLYATHISEPFNFSFNTSEFSDGACELFAKAHDAAGNVEQSETVLVYVNNVTPPIDTEPPLLSGTIEAEWGDLTSPMQTISDIGASGSSYIETTQSESGTAIYTFSIDNPGVYKIIARVYAPNAGSDSFYVNIDDRGEFIWDLNPAQDPNEYNIWRDDEITNRGTGTFDNPQYDPYTVELSQGEHTLVIRGREDSARLDYFYFEKVEDITPPTDDTIVPEDQTAPVASITSPEDGAFLSGNRTTVQVWATDDVNVARIELYVDDILKKVEYSDVLSWRWNIHKILEGQHTITAIAYDADGNMGVDSVIVYK